jgi:glucosamine--fructose-6-phosphate aminotransferase (isomerizing)
MCGIFGYIGKRDPLQTCMKGLELLEYRGYDSSGIAGVKDGEVLICKEIGKLSMLKQKLSIDLLEVAIGHTRWATHGKVTNQNAHPHTDHFNTIALVHNGIIENYAQLKEQLKKEGFHFTSETDTEVISNLIAKHYQGNLVEAVQNTLPHLKGHFAIAVIHKDHPEEIVAAARECPLSIGVSDCGLETMISSDPNAFFEANLNVFFLRQDEVALVQKGKVEIFDSSKKRISKPSEKLNANISPPSKEGYKHFMMKEIFEQPNTLQKAFLSSAQFEELPKEFKRASTVWFIGCGTSANAGMIGTYYLEDLAKIPAHSEIASEVKQRIIPKDALIVAISQSGETADTISAVRELRSRGHKVLGLCNVKNSTLPREVDACIYLNAGPEMSVCSTKAFTSQLTVLYLFAHFMAGSAPSSALKLIPEQISKVLQLAPHIQEVAQKYTKFNNFFFMGRRYMFPTCMEAALKLKEISYVNANGYPAGELKHGPIALIDAHFPVIAFCANAKTEDKIISNLQEVKARGAPVLALAPENLKIVQTIADDVIWLPQADDLLSPLLSTVAGQLFAYFFALYRGCDIDQPRNLAKSVTVE